MELANVNKRSVCVGVGVCGCTSTTVRTNRVTECACVLACVCVPVWVCSEKYEFVGKCQEVGSLMAELTDDP